MQRGQIRRYLGEVECEYFVCNPVGIQVPAREGEILGRSLMVQICAWSSLVETYTIAEVHVTHSSSLRCCVSMREQRRNITTYRLSPCTCRSREPWSDHRIALHSTVSWTQELRHASVHTTVTYMSMACGTVSIEDTSVQSKVLPPRMRMGVVG